MQAIRYLVVALCVINLAFAENVPVLLWGEISEAKPSLQTLHEEQFAELLGKKIYEKTLVVFVESGLTNKDFLCTNSTSGKSCFTQLQGIPDKTFYASVMNPLEALRSVAHEREYNSVDLSGKFSRPLKLSKRKIIVVDFGHDQLEKRELTLEKHDSIIASVTSKLGKDAIFMYTTSPSSSLKRQRRRTAASASGYIFRDGANLLLYFSSLKIVNKTSSVDLIVSRMNVKVDNNTKMSVTLETNASALTFDITLSGGYFYLKNVKYDAIRFRTPEVYAPTDFSYFCGNLTLSGSNSNEPSSGHLLKWNSFQIQAPFGSTQNKDFVFGDPWHCVGFFTGGILSGLLIVVLLLTITFSGVCWMMDINTMDRFDDPKGKTITINANE